MIRIWLALQMAVRELARNLTRTALTSLGILIGVGAVIAMVGLGTGATRSIEDDLASMGNNLIMMFYFNFERMLSMALGGSRTRKSDPKTVLDSIMRNMLRFRSTDLKHFP